MKNIKLIALGTLLLMSTVVMAQPAFDPAVDDAAPIPGIALAIAAAIGIGAYKLKRNK